MQSQLNNEILLRQSSTIEEEIQLKVISPSNNECPQIKNHSSIYFKKQLFIFGGYDGKKNHNTLHLFNTEKFEWSKPKVYGQEPEGRNGHSATLIENKIYIIGGWLGSGTFASSEVYILNMDTLFWSLCYTNGDNPGPCNMHSADLIGKFIYIFRGGDGRDYLNDLHTLNIDRNSWKYLNTEGENPPPRANHSSSVLKKCLYIFGGWDGSRRLNDLYCLDTVTNIWVEIKIKSSSPSPRAGMSLSALKNKLFLFGGSGPSASCFNDLQIYDSEKQIWKRALINGEDQLKPRAGHSMTIVGDKLYIMGGSYGQKYFKDFYILDTDPAPEIKNQAENSNSKIKSALSDYCNNPEFSDITFIVEGKHFYGHKVILSLLSERFKVMFNSGMIESQQNTLIINHISYPVFAAICQYLYTGEVYFGAETEGQEMNLNYLLEFLSVSDEFLLDEIKISCEKNLINLLNENNFNEIFNYAKMCNAIQLKKYCQWFAKKNSEINLEKKEKIN